MKIIEGDTFLVDKDFLIDSANIIIWFSRFLRVEVYTAQQDERWNRAARSPQYATPGMHTVKFAK